MENKTKISFLIHNMVSDDYIYCETFNTLVKKIAQLFNIYGSSDKTFKSVTRIVREKNYTAISIVDEKMRFSIIISEFEY